MEIKAGKFYIITLKLQEHIQNGINVNAFLKSKVIRYKSYSARQTDNDRLT